MSSCGVLHDSDSGHIGRCRQDRRRPILVLEDGKRFAKSLRSMIQTRSSSFIFSGVGSPSGVQLRAFM
jgi:hypothetical protein